MSNADKISCSILQKLLLFELTFNTLLLLLFLSLPLTIYSSHAQSTEESFSSSSSSSECITYNSEEKAITITCKSATLTDINNQLKDPEVLHKETTNGVWLLNADIIIEQDATLYINSTDSSWMKIAEDGQTANSILVSGSLKIDSVKITSWNPNTNDYALTEDSHREGVDVEIGTPRPYIRIQEEATALDSTKYKGSIYTR